ncbi:MAG: sulfite exporter TauE/SafE family protein [Cyanobacteria bacterium P01_F01_bin.42]
MPTDTTQLALVLSIVTVGAFVQSSTGIGFGLISAPLLLLINPQLVPGPMMSNGIILSFMIAYRDRTGIDFMGLKYALGGRILGLVPAALILSFATQTVFDFTFSILVLTAVFLSAVGLSVQPTKLRSFVAGAASGFMGTISGIGGPPIALLYQRSDALKLRGTLSGYFSIGATLSLLVLVGVGRYGLMELELALMLLPATILGFVLATPLASRLKQGSIRPLILALSFGSAAAVLWRAIATY